MRDHHQESSPNLANHLEKSGPRSPQHEESKKSLIKQSSSSEFTQLRQKIKEMKEKHQHDTQVVGNATQEMPSTLA
jgi:hypothetical protein